MKRDYYPLELAAEKLNCSKDYLIYLGAKGDLSISILTARFNIKITHVPLNDVDRHEFGIEHKKLMTLHPFCLNDMESGNAEAWVTFDRTPWYDRDASILGPMPYRLTNACFGPVPYHPNADIGRWHNGYLSYQLQHSDMFYPTTKLLMEYQKKGRNINEITPPPVLLKDCTMVVMHEDLNYLQPSDFKETTKKDKLLVGAERQTLLKLLYGMAQDKYGYKSEGRNNATGENKNSIKAGLERFGLTVDNGTVKKYLDEARELLGDED